MRKSGKHSIIIISSTISMLKNQDGVSWSDCMTIIKLPKLCILFCAWVCLSAVVGGMLCKSDKPSIIIIIIKLCHHGNTAGHLFWPDLQYLPFLLWFYCMLLLLDFAKPLNIAILLNKIR